MVVVDVKYDFHVVDSRPIILDVVFAIHVRMITYDFLVKNHIITCLSF